MAIEATSTLTSAAAALRLEDLLQVLLTELTHQNPLKPVENKDFMAQIAQFASLDASQRLNDNIERLLLVQAVNQSVGLLNRTVSARVGDDVISGVVKTVTMRDGVPRVTVLSTLGQYFEDIAIGDLQTIG